MENTAAIVKLADNLLAPFADSVIPLFLDSLTGTRYRTLHCLECGQEIIERNNEMIYRINDKTLPNEVHIDGQSIKATCGNCGQWYALQVAIEVQLEVNQMPLYLQPQSVYLVVDTSKRLRYLYCLECGRPFHSISDRIRQVTDNRIPFEHVDLSRIGPIETLCQSNQCGQTWALML